MNDDPIRLRHPLRRGSALVNISLILALLSCAASGYLYIQWKILISERTGFEAVRVQLRDQVASLETDLQSALKDQQKMKQSAAAESTEKAKTLLALAEATAAADQGISEIKKLTDERDALKKMAIQLKSQVNQLSNTINSRMAGTSAAVSEIAQHRQAGDDQPSKPMHVRTINRTFNFVVFDLVPGATFRVGDDAIVERDGRWISDLKIKQVYAQYVSADIRKEDDNNLLKIGDSVKRV